MCLSVSHGFFYLNILKFNLSTLGQRRMSSEQLVQTRIVPVGVTNHAKHSDTNSLAAHHYLMELLKQIPAFEVSAVVPKFQVVCVAIYRPESPLIHVCCWLAEGFCVVVI